MTNQFNNNSFFRFRLSFLYQCVGFHILFQKMSLCKLSCVTIFILFCYVFSSKKLELMKKEYSMKNQAPDGVIFYKDFMSFVTNVILLWSTVKINVFKTLQILQRDFRLVMAIFECSLFVEVRHCLYQM